MTPTLRKLKQELSIELLSKKKKNASENGDEGVFQHTDKSSPQSSGKTFLSLQGTQFRHPVKMATGI